jgi:hypothetical protein
MSVVSLARIAGVTGLLSTSRFCSMVEVFRCLGFVDRFVHYR